MNEKKHRIRLWGYGLLWLLLMLFIFLMSARDGEESSDLSSGFLHLLFGWLIPLLSENVAEFIIRKAAHMFEFLCLALASLRFFAELLETHRRRLPLSFSAAAVWSFLYACSDEWHQRFVPGRAGQFRDVLIDFSGALLGLLLAGLLLWLWKTRSRRRFRN